MGLRCGSKECAPKMRGWTGGVTRADGHLSSGHVRHPGCHERQEKSPRVSSSIYFPTAMPLPAARSMSSKFTRVCALMKKQPPPSFWAVLGIMRSHASPPAAQRGFGMIGRDNLTFEELAVGASQLGS